MNKKIIVWILGLFLFISFAYASPIGGGDLFDHDFDWGGSGTVGNGWVESESGSCVVRTDDNNLIVERLATDGCNGNVYHSLTTGTDTLFETNINISNSVDSNMYLMTSAGVGLINLFFDSGNIKYYNGTDFIDTGESYVYNEYTNYKFFIDDSSYTFSLFIGSDQILSNISFYNSGTVARVYFNNEGNLATKLSVDYTYYTSSFGDEQHAVWFNAYDYLNNSFADIGYTFNLTINGETNESLTFALPPPAKESVVKILFNLSYPYTAVAEGYAQSVGVTELLTDSPMTYNLTFAPVWLNVTAYDIVNGQSLNNFTVTASNATYSYSETTANGFVYVPLGDGTYNIDVTAPSLTSVEYNITPTTMYENYTANMYTLNSINFTFYDELTSTIMDGKNVTIDFISELTSQENYTTTGLLYVDLLSPSTYTLRYTSENYTERLYYFTLVNDTNSQLNLYLLPNEAGSTNVTVTILDEITNPVEGAYVKAMKYDLDTNTYILRSMGETDTNGKVRFDLILDTEFYKFVVEYDERIVKETTATYLYENEITIIVNIGDIVAEDYYDSEQITWSLNFTTDQQFRFFFNDPNNLVSQGCMVVDRLRTSTTVQTNTSCVSASSGTIFLGVLNESGATYRASVYVVQDGNTVELGSLVYTFKDENVTGNLGLYAIFILMFVFATLGYWSLELSLILTPIPLLFGVYLGLLNIGITIATVVSVAIILWGLIALIRKGQDG